MEPLDVAGLAIFFLCTIGYHLFYFYLMKRLPNLTVKTQINALRRAWMRHIIESRDYQLAATQMRDLITINTFLASTILISVGVLFNLLINNENLTNLVIIKEQGFEMKVLLVVAILMVSFFNYLSSLRNLRIITMLISVPPEQIREHTGEEAVDYFSQKVNMASTHYTLGTRGMFYTIPALFWLIGAEAFIAVTALMTLNFALRKDYRRKS